MTTAVGRDGFPAYTLHQWAKSDRSEPGRIHLLEHHLADVGACFEALLGQPTIRKRLARTGGREDLDRATVSRLSVLAALHDIGKVNMGFQTQIWRPEDLPGGRVPASFRRVGTPGTRCRFSTKTETPKHRDGSSQHWASTRCWHGMTGTG